MALMRFLQFLDHLHIVESTYCQITVEVQQKRRGQIIHPLNQTTLVEHRTSFYIMEQKRTINFGAGPAKLSQTVSLDPHFACATLIM